MVSGEFLLHLHIFGKNDGKGWSSFTLALKEKKKKSFLLIVENAVWDVFLKTIYLSLLTPPLFCETLYCSPMLQMRLSLTPLQCWLHASPQQGKLFHPSCPSSVYLPGTPYGAGAFLATLISPFHRWGNGAQLQMSIWLGRNSGLAPSSSGPLQSPIHRQDCSAGS